MKTDPYGEELVFEQDPTGECRLKLRGQELTGLPPDRQDTGAYEDWREIGNRYTDQPGQAKQKAPGKSDLNRLVSP